VLLCDIGNTTYTFYDGKRLQKYPTSSFSPETIKEDVYFISVNHPLLEVLSKLPNWHNLEERISKESFYETMGIDRVVCCAATKHGVIVDAGSAITVDVMKDGVFQGGFIYPGIQAFATCYGTISLALQTSLELDTSLEKLPKNTQGALNYGFLAPLHKEITSYDLPVIFTGGDAKRLATFFQNATVDELLIFKGMQKFL